MPGPAYHHHLPLLDPLHHYNPRPFFIPHFKAKDKRLFYYGLDTHQTTREILNHRRTVEISRDTEDSRRGFVAMGVQPSGVDFKDGDVAFVNFPSKARATFVDAGTGRVYYVDEGGEEGKRKE